MSRSLQPLFAQETDKSGQSQLLRLVAVQYPLVSQSEPGGWLYLVDNNYDVTFGGQLYVRFPLRFNGTTTSSDGTIDQATLVIGNVSREIMYYVLKCKGLRNMRVKIKSVYANALDFIYTANPDGTTTTVANPLANSTAYIEDEYVIDGYTATESVVTFRLYPILDLDIRIPRRRYMIDSCYWEYKDAQTCKYTGTLTSCEKNMKDCLAHSNVANFGGFPGINGTRKIYL